MDYIAIEGVPPYDGRWEFDIEDRELTTREWGWIKRLSGYLPLTIEDGLTGVDAELVTVLAAIALRRAGKVEAREVPAVFERLADAPFGSAITMETDVEEAEEGDAGPPVSRSNGSDGSSGAGSTTSSETSVTHLRASGMRDSASSVSVPPRSAS
jgi:hypothetical protein